MFHFPAQLCFGRRKSLGLLDRLSRLHIQHTLGVWSSGMISVLHCPCNLTDGPAFDPRCLHWHLQRCLYLLFLPVLPFFLHHFLFLLAIVLPRSVPVVIEREPVTGPLCSLSRVQLLRYLATYSITWTESQPNNSRFNTQRCQYRLNPGHLVLSHQITLEPMPYHLFPHLLFEI